MKRAKLKNIFSKYGFMLACLAIVIVLAFSTKGFFTFRNITNIMRQVSFNTITAFGMCLIIITGGIDLSVGSISCLSGITAALLAQESLGLPLIVAVLGGVLAGLLMGAINGGLITTFNLPPFICTLATTSIYRGIALVITKGKPIIGMSDAFNELGSGKLLNIPYAVWIMLAVFLVISFAFYFTRYGRNILAVGGNRTAAKFSGLKVERIIFATYVICGVLVGLSGVILTARLGAGSPTMSDGAEGDAIAATAIAGTNMAGGSGSIVGTVVGAMLLGIISNGMDLLNISSYYQQIVKGVIIIGAVLADRTRNKA